MAIPFLLVAGNAAGQLNQTGVWTAPGQVAGRSDWGYQQVHLALLRGGTVNNVNYHSYLISWELTGGGTTRNGLYGWIPGDPGYSAYPGEAYLKSFGSLPATGSLPETNVNLFCAGHSTLSDGRLLVSGGHVGHDVGIVDWRIFDPATRNWTIPPPSDTMSYARWYGTNTTLPSGQVLTTSGSRFFRSLAFGGSSSGDPATSNNDLRPGQLSYPDIVWEAPTPNPKPSQWPDPREGHTAAWLGQYNRMVVFGGRGTTDGSYLEDTWSLEYGQEVFGPNAGSYVVNATKGLDGPEPLYRHVATANYDGTFMLVHGGKKQAGGVSEDLHHFSKVGLVWTWSALTPSGDPPPGKRWGHAAAWDNLNLRMIVFGGRDESGEFADNDVYAVTVNEVTQVANWQKITPSGVGPSKREGHTLVWDSVRRKRPGELDKDGEWDRAFVFGGEDVRISAIVNSRFGIVNSRFGIVNGA